MTALIEKWIPVVAFVESLFPESFVRFVGAWFIFFVLLFVALKIIYSLFNSKPAPQGIDMPLLRPVPIPSKGRNFFMRILVWINEVRKWEVAEDWELHA